MQHTLPGDLDEEVALDAETAQANDTDSIDPLEAFEAELAGVPEADADDPFAELDGLIADGMRERSEAAAAKAARERMKRGGLSAVERAEDAARIRAWETKYEYTPEANVALFTQYECACGSRKTVFTALLERQRHKVMQTTRRWLPAEAAKADLPNETALTRKAIPVCWDCAPAKGWDLAKAYTWNIAL